MRAVVIVPWRGGDPVREANWDWARRWWDRLGYELVISEDPGPEPFNRAKALNAGAKRAWPWDVAVFIDADVFCSAHAQVTNAIVRAWDTGKFVLGHTDGRDLSANGTQALLSGNPIDYRRHTVAIRKGCKSRVNVLRADLFQDLGGWDERFHGWGHEDTAFYVAAEALAGEMLMVPGTTWHLWHEPMLKQSQPTQDWQDGRDLAQRYIHAGKDGWGAVQRILDERTATFGDKKRPRRVHATADLVVITSGRREYLTRTLASLNENVKGDIMSRAIFDDAGDPSFARWLDETYPGYTIIHHPRRLGFTGAVAAARSWIREHDGAPYVLWMEDDFIFRREVYLDEMATLLERKKLAQVALLRAPYYPPEIRAGSIPDEHLEDYRFGTFRGIRYMEHRLFFTTNPHLCKREHFDIEWPDVPHSETRFGAALTQMGLSFAFMGWDKQGDIIHIGKRRGGRGY